MRIHSDLALPPRCTAEGWVAFKQVCAAFTGANFFSLLLFCPETSFQRQPVEITMESVSNKQKQTISHHHNIDSIPFTESDVSDKTYWQSLKLWRFSTDSTQYGELLIRPYPLIVLPANFVGILGCRLPIPMSRMRMLIVVIDSISLGWIVIIASSISFILQAPPYNFSPGITALTSVPSMSRFSLYRTFLILLIQVLI